MHSDDDKLKKRLQHYQEEPDESVWDGIHIDLPADQLLGQRLRTHQELPDERVWKYIDRALYVNRHGKQLEWLANTAAVLCLLLLLIPASYLFDGQQSMESLTRKEGINGIPTELEKPDSLQPSSSQSQKTNEVSKRLGKRDEGGSGRALTGQKHKPAADSVMKTPLRLSETKSSTNSMLEAASNDSSFRTVSSTSTFALESDHNDTNPDHERTDSLVRVSDPPKVRKEDDGPATSNKKKERDGGALYGLVMPTLGYQQVTPVKEDGIIIQSFERVASFSPKRLGVRAEIGWEKMIGSKVALSVGVLYYQRQQTFIYQFSDTTRLEVKPVEGQPFTFDVKPAAVLGSFDYEVKNVGLTAGASFTFGGVRWVHKPGVNVELHRNLTGNGLYLFGSAFYRLAYPLNNRLQFIAQPTVNYALRFTEKLNAPFYVKPYGFGLSIGVIWRLNSPPNK